MFILGKKLKQFECPWTMEWINKLKYKHAIEYYTNNKNKWTIATTS